MSRLVRKALVLAAVQIASGTEAAPTPELDAVLVSEPEYSVDPEVLEREFVKGTLSPNPLLMGRKLAMLKFSVEVRGNGRQHSGEAVDVARLARLMRGSGFELTSGDSHSFVAPDFSNPESSPEVELVHAGPVTLTKPILYTITVSTAGASGAAEVIVSSNSVDDTPNPAPVILTSGTVLTLGTKGGDVTPTWDGDLTVGQRWRVLVAPAGTVAMPISDDMESITLHYYQDGLLHKITDAQGTFSLNAEAGKFASMEFTFTGKFHKPTDTPLPDVDTVKYEQTIPPKVEFANLTYQSNSDLIVNDFTFEIANSVSPRPSVNHEDGFHSSRVTERKPVGGFTPEAELEGTVAFWADMADSKRRTFYAKIGNKPGNTVAIFAPSVQTNRLGYGDREGILTYDVGLAFSGNKGDDEVAFLFV